MLFCFICDRANIQYIDGVVFLFLIFFHIQFMAVFMVNFMISNLT